jgi:predicted site-specific integrase-resolvase
MLELAVSTNEVISKDKSEDLRKVCPGREILSNIGSGVNFKRRNFQRLLERAFEGDIEEIAITYKDRL